MGRNDRDRPSYRAASISAERASRRGSRNILAVTNESNGAATDFGFVLHHANVERTSWKYLQGSGPRITVPNLKAP